MAAVLFTLLASAPGEADGQSSPVYNAEEIFLLMEGASQQYETLAAEIEATSYQGADEDGRPNAVRTRTITSRWTGDRSFSETTERYLRPEANQPEMMKTKMVITGKWNKRLDEIPGEIAPRGYIESGPAAEQAFLPPMAALWDINLSGGAMDWAGIDLTRTTVTYDEQSQCYVVAYPMGNKDKAAHIVLYVDPQKGFIPVRKEFRAYDGRLLQRYECKVQRGADGLWVPTEYSWLDPNPGVQYSTVYTIKKLAVNAPIPDEQLDFAFPSGTTVIDNVADMRYHVDARPMDDEGLDLLETDPPDGAGTDAGNERNASAKSSGGPSITKGDLQIRTLASDAALEAAAAQADASIPTPKWPVAGFLLIAVVGAAVLTLVYYAIRKYAQT